MATLTTNVAANLVPPGIIFSNLFSKFLTYKKSIIIVGFLAIIAQPWRVLENPNNYIYEVNGALATFLGPMAGIYLASYWLEYKSEIELVDLYRVDGGKYFYNKGLNKIALISLFSITLFLYFGKFSNSFYKIFYENSYVLGLLIGMLIYILWITIFNTNN